MARGTMDEGGAAFKRFEADGWTEKAPTYACLTERATGLAAEALLDAAGVEAGMRVLDVACGPGHLSEAAIARGAEPVGVDLAQGMLVEAARRLPRADLRRADAEDLPFGESEFDAVFGGFVLNHLPAPGRALAEAARVARPGARIAFSVWDRPERARLMGLVGDAIEAAGADREAGLPPGPDAFRFADDSELRAALRGAGLARVAVKTLALSVDAQSPGELWEGLVGGSVRSVAALRAQPPELRARVREEFEAIAAQFERPDGGLAVPAVAKIGSGTAPPR